MSWPNLTYARVGYQSFSRSARHILQLIGSHQNPVTGWAYLSYPCLSLEASLTVRRVIQLVALLEDAHVLEVRRGHGRGNVNFYRILHETDGLPVPHRSHKKVKSGGGEKVKFPTPPGGEKVKFHSPKSLETVLIEHTKEITTKERKEKGLHPAPFFLLPEKAECKSPFWCEAHYFCHSERLPDHLPECRLER